MHTQIRALHLMMSPTVEEYAQKRMLSLRKLVGERVVMCDVRLSRVTPHQRSGPIYRAEVYMNVGKQKIFAFSEKEDLYQAVDDVRDELERILTSQKKKKIVMFRKGAARIKSMLKNIRPNMYPFRKK